MPTARVEQIALLLDSILRDGARQEALEVLSLVAGRVVLLRDRIRNLRRRLGPARALTVAEACRRYPVSRSFLYERGEVLGICVRPNGARKLVVSEAALRAYLEGQ